MQFNKFLLIILFAFHAMGAGTYMSPPAIIEGQTVTATAGGSTTLLRTSETKQIFTGASNQTIQLPSATTMADQVGRRFYIINKSSGTLTVNDGSGALLGTVNTGTQAEFHLRTAASTAGVWDMLQSSGGGGGGGTWGSITGTLSAQTDLQAALDLKANLASPTFSGTIGTPLTASRALVTTAGSALGVSTATATQIGYLDTLSSNVQTQLNGKVGLSSFSAKGDMIAGVGASSIAALSLGGEGSYLLSDPNNITHGLRWGTPAGQINYIKQSQAEGGVVQGWATYADAAGVSPVDGTGGSPNSTFSTTSTAPLRGSNAFTFTLNTGATRQGEGVCYPVTIDNADILAPKYQTIEFDYKITSGTFVAGSASDLTSAGDSTLTVWVVDTTSGQVIQPTTYRLYSNTADRFIGSFQNNYNSANYRVCLHKGTSATVSGANIVTQLDDVKLSPSRQASGTFISDWRAFTPPGFSSTNGTSTGRWRQVGDTMEVTQTVEWAGAAGAFTGNFSIPSGFTIDTSKISGATGAADRFVLGRGVALDTGLTVYDVMVTYRDTTTINVWRVRADVTDAQNGGVSTTSPFSFGNTDTLNISYQVPIVGWASNTKQSDGFNSRSIVASYTGTSGTITNGGTRYIVDASTKVADKAGSVTTGAAWKFTAQSAGTYRLSYVGAHSSVTITSGAALEAEVFKNGSLYGLLGRHVQQAAVAVTPLLTGTILVYMNAGDYIDVREAVGGSVSVNIINSRIDIERLDDPATMSFDALRLFYTYTGSPTGTINTSYNTVTYGTGGTFYDTHGGYSSGVYTMGEPGCYDAKGSVQLTHTTAAGYLDVGISYNNSAPFVAEYKYVSGSGDTTQSVSGTICGKTGDTIRIQMKSNLTTPVYSSGAPYNYFYVSKRK